MIKLILIPPFGGSIPPAPAIDITREIPFWAASFGNAGIRRP
jgi:hypothetical protein